jgi:hypothetical protein
MTRRAVALSIAIAAAATAMTAGPAAAATRFVGSAVLVSDDIQGIVSVTQRGDRRRVRASVSLHGVTRNAGYRVVGARGRCSATKPGRSIFELSFGVEAAQDVFVTEIVGRTGSLADVRCVRVYEDKSDSDVPAQVSVGGFGGGVDDER